MDTKEKLKVCGYATVAVVLYRWLYKFVIQGNIFPDVYAITGLAFVCIIVDIVSLKPGKAYGLHAVFLQYAVQKVLIFAGYIVYNRLKRMSRNIQHYQNELLLKMIAHNSDTDVGRMMEIGKVKCDEDFRKVIPLTTYTAYEQYATVVEETGKRNVFFPGNVDYIAWTSGTTSGNSKKFPKSLSLLRKTSVLWLLLAQRCFRSVPGNKFLRKWLAVRSNPPVWRSKSGITCGLISGLASKYSLNSYVVPGVVDSISDEESVIYINLVFGLKHPDICNLFFSTAQVALSFFHVLEKKWKEICDDIEKGSLSEIRFDIVTPENRHTLAQSLGGGDEKRANFLRKEFQKGFKGIVPRVWPECPGLFCLASGSFQTQANVIKENYLGSVPLFSPFHAGTESFYGINLDLAKHEATYTLMVPFIFFEFIPVENIEEDNPETLFCQEVTIGCRYELVVTTWEGLYRYRTEDVVEITGFYGTIPCYKFIRRKNDVLSVSIERVPEPLVSEAVKTVSASNNKLILDFVTTENVHVEKLSGYISDQHYYIVFLEMQNDALLTEKEIGMIDVKLKDFHEMYKMFRNSSRLQAIKVIPVRAGTFQSMGELIRKLNKTTTIMQYKLPRIVRRSELLQHLLDNRLDRSEYKKWTDETLNNA